MPPIIRILKTPKVTLMFEINGTKKITEINY